MNRHRDEADWQVFRALQPVLLERLCQQVITECGHVIEQDSPARERYQQLFDLMRKRDMDVARCFDDGRRSTLWQRLLAIDAIGLLTSDERANKGVRVIFVGRKPGQSAPARTRYQQLFDLERQRDKDVARCFDDCRRSTMLQRLLALHARGLLAKVYSGY